MEENTQMNEIQTQTVLNFIAHCNHFIDGKYLFATNKLKEINEDIQSSEDLTLLKEKCLDGFNISLFKTKCLTKLPTKKGTFTSPTEKEDFIALAFCFIDDICNNGVDFENFTHKYFSSEKNENKFATQVIEPLKIIIAKIFNLPEDNESEFVIRKNKHNELKIDSTEAISIAKNITAVLSQKSMPNQNEKNAVIVLLELIDALQESRFKEIFSLKIALSYIQPYIKDINYLFEELLFCLDKIF